MDSIPSDPGVSMEIPKRRVSNNVFRPLSHMPDGTTENVQVNNASLPAGQRPILFQVLVTPVPSLSGSEHPAMAV